MPSAETTRGLDAGTRAEARVAQVWFWDGYYARRGVDLQHRFGSEVSTVTDVDVLGVVLDAALVPHTQIGEVKTGTARNTPRPLDRALWMRGLRDLVGAERGEVTTAFKSSSTVRDACRQMGVTVQHLDDLSARETRLRIANVDDLGSQGESMARLRADVKTFVKRDAVLERGYWFLVSEVWFLGPFDALKRCLGLIRELSKGWPPETHHDAMGVARWFFAEAISIATLNMAIIAGRANTMDSHTFAQTATAELATGDVPFYALRALAEHVDEYVAKLLTSLDAPADMRTNAMGAFVPTPPDYAEPLLELISRLASDAATTSQLPRQLDAVLFERLVRRRDLTHDLRVRLGITPNTERQVRLIAAFLRGQFKLPGAVDKVLTTALIPESQRGRSDQQTLFDQEDDPHSGTLTNGESSQRPSAS